MDEDVNKLQQMLEQATSVGNGSEADLDPEVRALRETWIDFGRLLEASQPEYQIAILQWKVPRPADRRRWLPTMATTAVASLLIGVLAVWIWGGADPVEPTIAINPDGAALVQQDEPRWDDALDEQIDQVGWNILCAQHDVNGESNGCGLIQDGIEQMQQELDENYL